MSLRYVVFAALACAAPVAAQSEPASPPARIQVSGVGIARTAPDIARLEFWLRGEGATPDDASRALATKQSAVSDGLRRLLGRGAEVTTGELIVIEVRSAECEDARGYSGRPRLSQGACAVTGYVATLRGAVRTGAVDQAGTAAGLASQLGASDARVQEFLLADPAAASREATAAALSDARLRAEAIATGTGVKLGPIISVSDGNYGGGEFVRRDLVAAPEAPPPPPPARVVLETKPSPIQTRAQVMVVYAIQP